jgi:hypothetical protein
VPKGLYVYAIARAGHPLPSEVEAIDGSGHIDVIADDALGAFCSRVDLDNFSQAAIDARANDVEWLGGIGYRHQAVMTSLLRGGTIIPLRAFTLFGSGAAVQSLLREQREAFVETLDRLEGKQEWTLRIEFEPQRWSEALLRRVEPLGELSREIERAPSGRAFLLRKKFDEEKKRASREAEQQVVAEIEREVAAKLACDTVAESRTDRGGAFPQINVLINRDEESRLEELRELLEARYQGDGVVVAVTGPWPPYSFASLHV